MNIRTRMCMSLDGHVTTPDGWPVQLRRSQLRSRKLWLQGVPGALRSVLIGRTTFEPPLVAIDGRGGLWTCSSSHRSGALPPPTTWSQTQTLRGFCKKVRAANRGGDVHLVGGPRTIETFRSLGALDKLGLIVLSFLIADGVRLTPALSIHTGLTLETEHALGAAW